MQTEVIIAQVKSFALDPRLWIVTGAAALFLSPREMLWSGKTALLILGVL